VLWEIWGTGPNDVWTGGSRPDGTGILVHGDGKYFDEVKTYQGPALRGIRATQPNDVWVAAYEGVTQHWDGATWTPFPTVQKPLLRLGGSASEVWAVGGSGTILKWSGAAWVATEASTKENVKSLWSGAPDDAWAVGSAGTILHWDGTSWTQPRVVASAR
jgi:hypothetical protein